MGGFLYALSLQSCELVEAGESVGCDAVSTLELTETVESAPYIRMTEGGAPAPSGAEVEVSRDERKYVVRGADASIFFRPAGRRSRGDWSNAAFGWSPVRRVLSERAVKVLPASR